MMFLCIPYIFAQGNIYFLKLYDFPSFSFTHDLGIIFPK